MNGPAGGRLPCKCFTKPVLSSRRSHEDPKTRVTTTRALLVFVTTWRSCALEPHDATDRLQGRGLGIPAATMEQRATPSTPTATAESGRQLRSATVQEPSSLPRTQQVVINGATPLVDFSHQLRRAVSVGTRGRLRKPHGRQRRQSDH